MCNASPQRFFADDLLEGKQHRGCLAVSDGAVGVAVVKTPGESSDRIGIGPLEVREALRVVFAQLKEREIEFGGVFAVERVHTFRFHVAVDAFVEPGFFEFVRRHHAVPVLMAEFMLGDEFGQQRPLGHKPIRCPQ